MNMQALYAVAVLALAVSAISVTITKAKVSASARHWISSRNEWLGDLVSCPYCTSHWVSLAVVAIYQPVLVPRLFIIDLLVSVFVIVAIASLVIGAMTRVIQFPRSDAFPRPRPADREEEHEEEEVAAVGGPIKKRVY